MDKYEYRVKTDQMVKYLKKGAYSRAMEIADTIDWRRVKDSAMLKNASEIYENCGKYQKSRDILFIAYERSPGSRKIVYNLGIVALKLHDIDDALDCYEEFVKLAPKDPNQFILRYKILRAQNAPIDQQTEALEEFKKAEYVEKWAYELARLYHEAGKTADCLEECDDLILWFSEGKYVYQAMELKMQYKPLTKLQQEKYSRRNEQPKQILTDDLEEENIEENMKEAEPVIEKEKPKREVPKQERVKAVKREVPVDEPSKEADEVQEESVPKSSIKQTVLGSSFAEAIANGMAMVSGKKTLVQSVEIEPEPELEEVEELESDTPIRTAEPHEKVQLINPDIPEFITTSEHKATGAEEQLEVEKQITGQMRIEEILSGWEAKQREIAKSIEGKKKEEEEHQKRILQEQMKQKQEALAAESSMIPSDIQRLMDELEAGVLEKPVFEETSQVKEEKEKVKEVVENKGTLVEQLMLSEDEEEESDEEDWNDDEKQGEDFSELDEVLEETEIDEEVETHMEAHEVLKEVETDEEAVEITGTVEDSEASSTESASYEVEDFEVVEEYNETESPEEDTDVEMVSEEDIVEEEELEEYVSESTDSDTEKASEIEEPNVNLMDETGDNNTVEDVEAELLELEDTNYEVVDDLELEEVDYEEADDLELEEVDYKEAEGFELEELDYEEAEDLDLETAEEYLEESDEEEYEDVESYEDEEEYEDEEAFEDEEEYEDEEAFEDEEEYEDEESYEDEEEYEDEESYENGEEYDEESYEDEEEYDDVESYEDGEEYDEESYEDEEEYDDVESYEDEEEYDDVVSYEDEEEYDEESYEDEEEYDEESYDDKEEHDDVESYEDEEEYEDESYEDEEEYEDESYEDEEEYDDVESYEDEEEYEDESYEEDEENYQHETKVVSSETSKLAQDLAMAFGQKDEIEAELEFPEATDPVISDKTIVMDSVEEIRHAQSVNQEEPAEEAETDILEQDIPKKMSAREKFATQRIQLEEFELEESEEHQKKSNTGSVYDTGFIVQGRYDLEAQSEIGLKAGLTEEQKKLFSYFVPVRGMSEQIVDVLAHDKKCKTRYGTSRTGNLLVIGRKGMGKTVLAVDVVKAIQKSRKLKQGKVAIVTGEALNKKEVSDIIDKLHGGAIIIEKAAKMNSRTVRELNDLMEEQTGELLVVLEEQRKPLERMMKANPDFKKKFTSKLELPTFINDELVTFGQTYAKENGYRIDEMGILALYSRIDVMQREDHAVSVAEVKEIMDEAIEHSQKANVKHLVKRVFGKTTDDADRIILKEQDFKL